MTCPALSSSYKAMVHAHIGPARVTVAILAASQCRMSAGTCLVAGMTTGSLATRCETAVIEQCPAGKTIGTAMTVAAFGTRGLAVNDIHGGGPPGGAGSMATQAPRGNTQMLESGRGPACRRPVTGITIGLLIHVVYRIHWWQRDADMGRA